MSNAMDVQQSNSFSRRSLLANSASAVAMSMTSKVTDALGLSGSQAAIDKTHLGIRGPQVSRLGIGCMGMSEFYGRTDTSEAQRMLAQAFDRGVTLFDTADLYGNGHNETLLGEFIAGRRDRVTIETKFGIVRGGSGWHVDNSPAYVRSACEASLRRLNTDYIDVLFAHRIAPEHPVEEMVATMAELVRAGKVRAIGLSEAAPMTIRKAHAVHPLAAVQTEYSLLSRGPEQAIIPTCRELGIGFVAYSPLSRGLLTNHPPDPEQMGADDFRKGLPRFQPNNFAANRSLVNRLRPMADRKKCTIAQLCLAWLLSQGRDIIPIPGMRRISHLDENLGALTVRLLETDLAEIERLAPQGSISGERYTDEELNTVGL